MTPSNVLARPAQTIGIGLTALGLVTSAGIGSTAILDSQIVYDQSTGAWMGDSYASSANIYYTGIQTGEVVTPRSSETSLHSSADAVKLLRAESGLTWDQLSRLFGVSRRALHHWASGGRMNSINEEHLNEIREAVRRLPVSEPGERRSLLLSTPDQGPSIFEQLKAHRPAAEVLQASAYSPDALLGGTVS